jgi:5-methylcytosine-specific restriction protein A
MMPPRRCPTCRSLTTARRCPTCVQRQAPQHQRFAKTIDYTGKRWRTLRAQVLSQSPLCPCGAVATVVDHVRPHRGNAAQMFEPTNLQALCKSCHDRKTWGETLANGGQAITGPNSAPNRVGGRFSQNQNRGRRG